MRDPPRGIDLLLMEGSSFGRLDPDRTFPTETEIETRFVEIFAGTEGMALVAASAQNIDRMVSLYRAAKLAEMLRAAATLSGPEKSGVHDLVLASPRVIDVEISLSSAPDPPPGTIDTAADGEAGTTASNAPSASSQDCLDVAALDERAGGIVVTFHEAKHFDNKEPRARADRTPPVAEQIARYRKTLMHQGALAGGSLCALRRRVGPHAGRMID